MTQQTSLMSHIRLFLIDMHTVCSSYPNVQTSEVPSWILRDKFFADFDRLFKKALWLMNNHGKIFGVMAYLYIMRLDESRNFNKKKMKSYAAMAKHMSLNNIKDVLDAIRCEDTVNSFSLLVNRDVSTNAILMFKLQS